MSYGARAAVQPCIEHAHKEVILQAVWFSPASVTCHVRGQLETMQFVLDITEFRVKRNERSMYDTSVWPISKWAPPQEPPSFLLPSLTRFYLPLSALLQPYFSPRRHCMPGKLIFFVAHQRTWKKSVPHLQVLILAATPSILGVVTNPAYPLQDQRPRLLCT